MIWKMTADQHNHVRFLWCLCIKYSMAFHIAEDYMQNEDFQWLAEIFYQLLFAIAKQIFVGFRSSEDEMYMNVRQEGLVERCLKL